MGTTASVAPSADGAVPASRGPGATGGARTGGQAIDRLDDTLQRLALRRSALRQERIVEEIEVLLASAMATAARVERVGAASGSGARP